jgi:hypothetical protein
MRWRLAISFCCMALLAACGELQDWQGTQKADTLEAYQAFLERYPQSQYAPVAERRIANLAEERDWQLASERDTADAYRQFVDTYPKGRWASEARLRLQNFMAAPGVLGPAALEPVERPVVPIRTPELKPTTGTSRQSSDVSQAKGVQHRIQLGAFSTREKAEQGWQLARNRYPDLRGLVPQILAASSTDSSIYRLRAGVVSEARAREICTKLASAGQACVYVPPGR